MAGAAFVSRPAAADAVPDAASIRHKIAEATGPEPHAYRETDQTSSSNGEVTVEHDVVRGDDFRYTFDTGKLHTEYGVVGPDHWHMNDNGQVVLDQPDPGEATPEHYETSVTAIHQPVEGYVLARLNVQHHGIKEYVDAATWRVVRRESISENGTVVTTYDDVRTDAGRTFAHHVHIDDGYARTSSDIRILEYTAGDVSDAEVAIPSPRRALVAFPSGTASVQLPATFLADHVVVRVDVDGRGLDFVLDSGAAGITIDTSVARDLHLPEYRKESTVEAGRYTTARTIVPEMHVGPLVMRDVAVQIVPDSTNAAVGVKEVGLLGFDFLAELGVTVDYEHQRVTVVPGTAYVPPSDPHTVPVDVRVGDGQPLATVTLNGAVGERWVLDTGGAGTFLIFDYFARRHPEALRDKGGGSRNVELEGIGGAIEARPYQIGTLKLASVNFRDFVGYRVTGAGSYSENEDGIIGTDFLRLFTLGFDYANSRVYLVPNRYGRAAMGIK